MLSFRYTLPLCLLAVFVALSAAHLAAKSDAGDDLSPLSKEQCNCTLNNCMCCRKLDIKHVIDKELCLNTTYDGNEEITVSLIIGNTHWATTTFSEDDKFCKSYYVADICLQLDDFHSNNNGTCGCFGISVSAFSVTFGPFDFGCFHMGHDCQTSRLSVDNRRVRLN